MIKSVLSAAMALTLTSPDFKDSTSIPIQLTCKGKDLIPTLQWTGAPQSTQTFVLTMVDPDAPNGSWTHWVLYNIPSSARELSQKNQVGTGGLNSWNNTNYGGPCPPSGVHHYIFTLYAVDIILDLKTPPTLKELTQAIEPHILAKAQLVGLFP